MPPLRRIESSGIPRLKYFLRQYWQFRNWSSCCSYHALSFFISITFCRLVYKKVNSFYKQFTILICFLQLSKKDFCDHGMERRDKCSYHHIISNHKFLALYNFLPHFYSHFNQISGMGDVYFICKTKVNQRVRVSECV